MDNDWSYIDFETLMDSILKGDTPIQEQITINNNSHSQTNNISFLTHLLKYDNINKDNLLENLFKIYKHFVSKIEELKKNKAILLMMERINNEWYSNDDLSLSHPFNKHYFTHSNNIKKNYNELCNVCDSAIISSEERKRHPLEERLQSENIYERELNSGLILCKNTLTKLNHHLEETQELINFFKSFNTPLYMDLSIKHRPLYHQLIGEDNNIPINIHRIFSNFLHIHNLLFKQLVQHHHSLKQFIQSIEGKSKDIDTRLSNIKAIAILPFEEEEEEDKGKEVILNVGDNVYYKGTDIVKIIAINKNVPVDEDPIIYIQFNNGTVRDTLLEYLSEIDGGDDHSDDDDSDDGSIIDEYLGSIENDNVNHENAKNISKKLVSSFY